MSHGLKVWDANSQEVLSITDWLPRLAGTRNYSFADPGANTASVSFEGVRNDGRWAAICPGGNHWATISSNVITVDRSTLFRGSESGTVLVFAI